MRATMHRATATIIVTRYLRATMGQDLTAFELAVELDSPPTRNLINSIASEIARPPRSTKIHRLQRRRRPRVAPRP